MRIGVMSDTHNHLANVARIVELLNAARVERVVHTGDITQAKTRPPGFVLFGTRLDMLPESYRRYLVNGIRRELGFDAVPIRLTLRSPKNPFKRD